MYDFILQASKKISIDKINKIIQFLFSLPGLINLSMSPLTISSPNAGILIASYSEFLAVWRKNGVKQKLYKELVKIDRVLGRCLLESLQAFNAVSKQ